MVIDSESGEFDDASEPDAQFSSPDSPQAASDLVPFDPPADFDHGEEFQPEIPRPIPRKLRRGSFARRNHGIAMTWTALGAAFVLISPWDVVWKMSFYVLPLAYLGWVGLAMIAIGVIVLIQNRLTKKRFEYVVSGQPFVGRVLDVQEHETVTINPETKAPMTRVRNQIAVEYENPETRRSEFATLLTDESWDKSQTVHHSLEVQPGDYATLVAMPGNIAASIRIYGLLGLDPKRELLKFKGKPLSGISPVKAIAIAGIVFGILWMFVGFFYVLTFCFPEEWNWPLGMTAMGLGGVAGAILGLVIQRNSGTDGKDPNKSSAVVLACSFGLIGLFAGLMGLGLINALCDKSPSRYQPIEVVNHWQTTHNFIIRDYELEYSEFGIAKTTKAHVSVDTLLRIGHTRFGVKELRDGGLGLEWIAGYHPLEWLPVDNPTPEQLKQAVVVRSGTWSLKLQNKFGITPTAQMIEQARKDDLEMKTIKVYPLILLPDGKTALAPDALVQRAKSEIQDAIP
ncbi:MAG: hypothetical protein WCJ09_03900 [Planctomycetota bacterium]